MFICIRDRTSCMTGRQGAPEGMWKRPRQRRANHATRIEHILKDGGDAGNSSHNFMSCVCCRAGLKSEIMMSALRYFRQKPEVSSPSSTYCFSVFSGCAASARLHLCVIICFGLMEDKHFMAASRSHGLALTFDYRTTLRFALTSYCSPLPLLSPLRSFNYIFAHSQH